MTIFRAPRGAARSKEAELVVVKIMATQSETSISFEESDTRHDEMHSTIEHWIDELVDHVDDAQESNEFQEWLDVQSRFHDYSHRNTLLIKLQCPEATKVAGYTPGGMISRGTSEGRAGDLDLGSDHHQVLS